MRGEGVLRDRSQPRAWSRKRTVNDCEMKRNLDNVVFIDVDGERFDNVIIIDVPESLQHKIGGSSASRKGKKFQFRGVISIDDDDDDEDADSPEMGSYSGCDMESDTSSSKSFPASQNVNKSVDLDDDECQVVQEKNPAFTVSRCKQASGKDPCGSRCGLYGSSSSDSDGSDCEVMEGSFGPLHKEWVKASLKRKSNAQKGKSGIEDQASPSCLNRQSPQGQSFRANQEEGGKQSHYTRANCTDKQQNPSQEHVNFRGFNWNFHHYSSFGDEEASLCKRQQSSETHDNNEKVVPSYKHEQFSQATSCFSSSPGNFHHAGNGSTEKDKPISGERLVSDSRPSYETGGEYGVASSDYNVGSVFEDSFSRKTHSFGMQEVCNENAGQHNVEKLDSKVVSSCSTQFTETQSKQGSPCVADIKGQVIGSVTNDQPASGTDPIHAQVVSFTPALGEDIINEREKLKQTDEYKRAMEEEWASRQQQLQIQAEEAKRLRKKKRAESMRLLDMERRQKLRLEEIRETQKKDQENMNLKEQLRAEVRRELYKLETTCIDMVSLLRALGIYVGGSFHPLSKEVHAAYKQALLRFHPDRASKTDIRQQVEAEEKFKLISRMKEKFLLTTCP